MPSKDLAKFNENLMRTNFGVRFARRLFTEPESMRDVDITKAMRILGLNIPREVTFAKDAAQLLSSGSALVESIQTAESLQSVCTASGETFSMISRLAKDMGWMDENSTSTFNVAGSVLRIFSTGGVDIVAWAQLCMEVLRQEEVMKQKVKSEAIKTAISGYRAQISIQSENLGRAFTELNKGSVGIFGFIVEAAKGAPILFENAIIQDEKLQNLLPGLKFIPVFESKYEARVTGYSWYGSTSTESYAINYRTINQFSSSRELKSFLFEKVIEPYTLNYLQADGFYKQKNKASIFEAALLMLVAGRDYIYQTENYFQVFRSKKLTPFDIGDSQTFEMSQKLLSQSGVMINGQALSGSVNQNYPEKLKAYQSGKIEAFETDDNFKKVLKERYNFDYFPQTETLAKIDWRLIKNLIACLDYIDMVRLDPGFQGSGSIEKINSYNGFYHLDDFKRKLNDVYGKSFVRANNSIASEKIALLLGRPVNKLVNKNKFESGIPAKY